MGARIHKMKNVGAGSARPYTSTNAITIRTVSDVRFLGRQTLPLRWMFSMDVFGECIRGMYSGTHKGHPYKK